MFGYIYRTFVDKRGIFWDGREETLRYCINPEQARKWWRETSALTTTIELPIPPQKVVSLQIPIANAEYEFIPSDAFAIFINEAKMESRMRSILNKVADAYEVDASGVCRKRVAEKKIAKKDFGVLLAMRDIIEGLFRITPIKVQTGNDKDTQKPIFHDWGIGSDIMNAEYEVQGKKYKTNLFGVYVPAVRDAMFPESNFDGYSLQSWQRDFLLNRGKITFVLAMRSAGKSMVTTSLIGNYLFKELSTHFEKVRPFDMHYFGLSKDANSQVAGYVRNMMLSLIENRNVIQWKSTDQRLSMRDGLLYRNIKYMSQFQEGVGRGERPALGVIDEADRMDFEVYMTMKGTPQTPIVAISTINYETKKSWFTSLWNEANKKQRDYEPIDVLIHRIWTKYGLDKCTSSQDYQDKIDNGDFEKMREEFYAARPMVALKYDITQIEVYTEEQKKQMIDEAMMISEEYCLAELFCEYADSVQLFNTEGLEANELPERFDEVTCGYDESDGGDNPAIVFTGFHKNIAYVLHEESLAKDPIERARRAKELMGLYSTKSKKGVVLTGADITRGDAYYREIEDTMFKINVPVYYTKSLSEDVKIERPKHKIGKRLLVKITKDDFFGRGGILFSYRLRDDAGSLLDEIKYFKRRNNGTYAAETGHKDDKVNALMLSLYVAYTTWMKDDIRENNWRMDISREELIAKREMMREMERAEEEENKLMAQVYSAYW